MRSSRPAIARKSFPVIDCSDAIEKKTEQKQTHKVEEHERAEENREQ